MEPSTTSKDASFKSVTAEEIDVENLTIYGDFNGPLPILANAAENYLLPLWRNQNPPNKHTAVNNRDCMYIGRNIGAKFSYNGAILNLLTLNTPLYNGTVMQLDTINNRTKDADATEDFGIAVGSAGYFEVNRTGIYEILFKTHIEVVGPNPCTVYLWLEVFNGIIWVPDGSSVFVVTLTESHTEMAANLRRVIKPTQVPRRYRMVGGLAPGETSAATIQTPPSVLLNNGQTVDGRAIVLSLHHQGLSMNNMTVF